MTLLVADPCLRDRLIAERRASGSDRFDEVWDGVRVIPPTLNDEHQRIVSRLTAILILTVDEPGQGDVRPWIGISDREDGWEHNYRVPDVAVRLRDGKARIVETHWVGGPDFLIEVLSPGDRARDKLDFYARIGAREVLIVDRDPSALELYGLRDGRLLPLGVSRPEAPQELTGAVVPLGFRLIAEGDRPRIEVVHPAGGQRWVF